MDFKKNPLQFFKQRSLKMASNGHDMDDGQDH
jgi:hypothetical protein